MRFNTSSSVRIKSITNVFVFPICLWVYYFCPSNLIISLAVIVMGLYYPGSKIVSRFSLADGPIVIFILYSLLFSIFIQSFGFYLFQILFQIFGNKEPFTNLWILAVETLIFFVSSLFGRTNEVSSPIVKALTEVNYGPRELLVIFFALFSPIFSLLAVQNLNNNGSGKLSAIVILTCFFLLLLIYIRGESLGKFNSTLLLYSIVLTLLFGSYFRGDGGFWGFDINNEFAVASETLRSHSQQSVSINSYGSMLSITVLPVVFSIISKLSLVIIFKVFYALLLAFLVIAILELLKRFVPFATGLLIVIAMILGSISFLPQMPALNRQTVGFLFFLGILSEVSRSRRNRGRLYFVVGIFSLGMAFSHYSVSYIAALIFILSSALKFALEKIKTRQMFAQGNLTISLALLITATTVLWNGILFPNIAQLNDSFQSTTTQGLKLLPNSSQSFIQRWLTATVRQSNDPEQIKINELEYFQYKNPKSQTLKSGTEVAVVPTSYKSSIYLFGQKVGVLISWLFVISTLSLQFLVFTSIAFLFFKFIRTKSVYTRSFQNEGVVLDLLSLSLFAFLLALISRISGTVSHFYNPERLGLQVYLIFALTFSLFLNYLSQFSRILIKIITSLLVFICLLQLIFATEMSGYLTGNLSARISNAKDVDQGFIISYEERKTAQQISLLLVNGSTIVADKRGLLPFNQVNSQRRLKIKVGANPYLYQQGDYVYISRANIVTGISYNSFTIKTPIQYLDSNFDRVYVSDNTRVYR